MQDWRAGQTVLGLSPNPQQPSPCPHSKPSTLRPTPHTLDHTRQTPTTRSSTLHVKKEAEYVQSGESFGERLQTSAVLLEQEPPIVYYDRGSCAVERSGTREVSYDQ